jgi:hypothetical protein
MTGRLAYLETLLRSRDVGNWPEELRAERARNLDRLRDYRLRGIYPANYDHPEAQKPCFIDRDGHICAVGYLVEQSAGRELAEKINSRYQYATVAEMHMPEIDRWIAGSGLTPAEVRTIQEPGSMMFSRDILEASRMPEDTVSLASFRGTSLEEYMKRPQPDSASVDISGAGSYQRAMYATFGAKPAESAAQQ